MDTLTHYMISWLIGKKFDTSPDKLRAFLLGSIAPDVDIILVLAGFGYYRAFHATVTHSIFTGVVLVILIALLLKRIYPASTKYIDKFAYAGILVHNFVDIVFNSSFFQAIEMLGFPVSSYFDPPRFTGGNTIFWPVSDVKGQIYLYFDYSILLPFTMTMLALSLTYLLVYRNLIDRRYPWDIWKK